MSARRPSEKKELWHDAKEHPEQEDDDWFPVVGVEDATGKGWLGYYSCRRKGWFKASTNEVGVLDAVRWQYNPVTVVSSVPVAIYEGPAAEWPESAAGSDRK